MPLLDTPLPLPRRLLDVLAADCDKLAEDMDASPVEAKSESRDCSTRTPSPDDSVGRTVWDLDDVEGDEDPGHIKRVLSGPISSFDPWRLGVALDRHIDDMMDEPVLKERPELPPYMTCAPVPKEDHKHPLCLDDPVLMEHPEHAPCSDAAQAPLAREALPRPDWWREADLAAINGLSRDTPHFQVLSAHIVRADSDIDPSLPSDVECIMEELIKASPATTYANAWVHLGDSSLLLLLGLDSAAESSEHGQEGAIRCLAECFLMRRLQLVVNSVKMGFSWPWTGAGPTDIDSLGKFFRRPLTSCTRSRTASGIDYLCLQIDFKCSPLQSKMIRSLGLRRGNALEVLLIDWPSKAPFAACRLDVTADFMQRLSTEQL